MASHAGIPSAERVPLTAEPAPAGGIPALLDLVTETARTLQAEAGAVVAEFALSPTAAAVLWSLRPGADVPTMRMLAVRLGCDPSTISLAADQLRSAGLVERRPHPTDGRKRVLALTDAGHDLWETVSARLEDHSRLTALSPQERGALAAILRKLNA